MKHLLTAALISGLLLGSFALSRAATVLFPSGGGTGTSTAPTLGQVLVAQTNGIYAPQATSTLGIPVSQDDLSDNTTSDLAEGSNLYYTDARVSSYITGSSTLPAHINYWTLGSGNVYRTTGNVGIGTTSPLARHTVQGSGATAATTNLRLADSNGRSLFEVNDAGYVGMSIAPSTLWKLDFVGQYFQMGSDNTSNDLRTNNTVKLFGIVTPHYANASNPVWGIGVQNTSVANNVFIGGGVTSGANAATTINFATGANTTAGVGTVQATLSSNLLRLGAGDATATPSAFTIAAPRVAGVADTAGANTTFISSLATGNANSGDFIWQTGAVGGSGSTIQTATTRMTLKGGTGNLGIGTTSPYAQLSLGGGDLVLGAASAGGTPGDLFLPKLGTAAGAFLAVDASGKVIATTTPSSGSGTVTSVDMTVPTGLTVSGNPITTSGTLALNYAAGYSGVLTASTTNWNTFYDTPSSRITAGTGLSWSGNTLNASLSDINYWTLSGGNVYRASGNVGIGTSPATTLHLTNNSASADIIRVAGLTGQADFANAQKGISLLGASMNAGAAKYAPMLAFGSTDPQFTTTNPKFLAAVAGYATQTYGADDDSGMGLEFFTTPDDAGVTPTPLSRMVIDQNGNVGIGTTSPAKKFSVAGDALISGFLNVLDGLATKISSTLTLTVEGAFGIDSTSNQFQFRSNGASRVLGDGNFYPALTYSTSTLWVGTTTFPIGTAYVAETWNGVQCFTDTGTLNVVFHDGTNNMNLFNASTTPGTVALTTNNTFTAAEKRYVSIGTPASNPTKLSCTVSKSITAN